MTLNSFSQSCVSERRITTKSNGLCRICNANQELKIRQLAVYEPFREENYDQEIEWFKLVFLKNNSQTGNSNLFQLFFSDKDWKNRTNCVRSARKPLKIL